MGIRWAQDVPQSIKGHVYARETTCLLYLVNAIARMVSSLQSKQVSEVGTNKVNKQVTLLYEDNDSHDDVLKTLSEAIDEGMFSHWPERRSLTPASRTCQREGALS